jgi:hypothetical protein
MKKILIVVATVAFAFAACGKKKDAAAPSTTPDPAAGSAETAPADPAAGSDAPVEGAPAGDAPATPTP